METPSLSFQPFSSLPLFFCIFLSTYLLGYFLIFRNWGPTRPDASSCLMSLAHGSPAVVMAARTMLTSTIPGAGFSFASPNTDAQTVVLDFSIAYFTIDLFHYLFFFPGDVLFILHHVATLYVFATSRFVVGHGAHVLLVLLVLAEVTSVCQNVWSIAGYREHDVALAKKVRELLSPLFYAFYSVVRGVLGPVVLCEMAAFYVSGAAEGLIPTWAWVSWLVVIGTAISVSDLWVLGKWVDWFEERSSKALEKAR